MRDTTQQHATSTWSAARREMTIALRTHASRRAMVCYSDLLAQVTAIRFELDDVAYHRMLAEISRAENQARRGLLSAIVVHKLGDQEPGRGFFDLAADLGRDTRDRLKCWTDEVKLAFDVWANQRTNIHIP